ncbi:hypothetical protein TCAL_09264 [Tigriopus californicus]|uniref:G-protein coupled receptors family 2 profile 2 domain-containing protein n=1 Tax=Tigriopus californicus TaxID=6832 RepID=A0A553N863_TIGCA|nr:uncharacterized protein LOC131884542 [Tigriopus californicus]TRY61634.1 hypothetical protein TCAL_09264 [Tigriopus californicus]
MIGCHRTPQDDTARKFSHGTYDELAFWARALNSSEEAFFLGGYKDVFENVGTDDLLKILNFIDYADVNQADTAINIMESIVNGEEEQEEEFRNIYPETTPTPSDTTEDENGSTSTTSISTTTTTGVPKKDPTKDVKNLMKIAKKLTGTGSLNYYITKREFDVRMKAVSPLGEFMGIKGKYAEGWTALKKDKNEAGPFETLTNLKNYVKYNIERYTVIPPESKLREIRRVVTSNNFAMEAFKMSSANFGKLGTAHTNGYFKFPNWNTPEWTRAKASFGYTQSQDRPTESVDISSELFTEECKKKDINFVGMISDTFPDHGRKNPSSIFANHIELDSRVITLDITANQMDTEPESPTANKFSERCEIDPKLAIKDPFIITFAIKSKRNHDFGRKLTSYYDSFDDKRVTNRHCVIWNEDIGPFGAWDTRGVTLVKADDAQATCYATKLGIYAIVAEIEDVPHAEDDETWLNIVKFIGYAVSIILLLIFIGVVLSSTYLWEMFHLIAVNMAFCLLFGHIFMLISEVNGIRDDRDSCSAIGLLILFFYSGLSVFITMECYAMFKAIISGIIGGHTRTYLCFGYGVPLFHMGLSIYLHLQEMGTDPRCMVGWANEVKEAFYIPVAIFGILSVFLITIIVCNINTPAMRKESMVEELGSLAKGLGMFVLLYGLTWSWFPFAYMRFPTHEFPDFYPAFQVMNAFMGMFFFVFIGLMSNRFRTALTGGILMRRKALLADASADDNYKEQVDDDTITTMDDLEHGDDDEEEDIEAAPRSRPVSGKSAKQELSEEVEKPEEEILPDPNEDDIPIISPETEEE